MDIDRTLNEWRRRGEVGMNASIVTTRQPSREYLQDLLYKAAEGAANDRGTAPGELNGSR